MPISTVRIPARPGAILEQRDEIEDKGETRDVARAGRRASPASQPERPAKPAQQWAAVFYGRGSQDERRAAGRRAATAYRERGDLKRAQEILRALVRLGPPDRLTREELARLEMALAAASAGSEYWHSRKQLLYYQVVRELTRRIASNADSIVDVGSLNTPVLEWFPAVSRRVSVDLRYPYRAAGIESIKADFIAWQPDRNFDVGLCLQVLEHVPNAREFAQKLLELCDIVIASVPYRWHASEVQSHVHDPVDETKLASWFGLEPNYSYVVHEVKRNWPRIVCVYDTESAQSWSDIDDARFRYRWSLRGTEAVLNPPDHT